MDKFTTLTGVAAPLPIHNLDTDKIFPAIYLKTIKRTGLAQFLFQEIRFKPDGSENPDFVLNQAPYRKAQILIGAENFGCGSSREHAPWALYDYGIRCVIAPSFADIFYNNCFNNGILPATLPAAVVKDLLQESTAREGYQLNVDLATQKVTTTDGREFSFVIDSFKKESLLQGLDNIGWTLSHGDDIANYESRRKQEAPWLFARQPA